jgi:hypothetical protein
LFATLRSRIRGLIRGQRPRGLGRRGARPRLGAAIVRDDLRITVQAGMSDELWQWLMERAWREPNYYPDRRQYRDIPTSWVTKLIDAFAEDREAVLAAATAKAVHRPTLRNAQALRSKINRR